MAKKIIVSVISDLVTDQRVQKECNTLYKAGYEVLLIGRKSHNSFALNELPFKVTRFNAIFKKGPLMYLVFNTKLLFFLLFKNAGVLWANDLDTLLPNFVIARLKKIQLVYDSHEYFTLTVYKKIPAKIWSLLETIIFPGLKNVITVNNSIKNVYEEKYKVPITVLRNMPYKGTRIEAIDLPAAHKNKKILIIQGTGINEHRGAEEAVEMMQYLPEEFILFFLGGGTIIEKLKQMTLSLDLSNRIFFMGILPYPTMMGYTRHGFAGLVLEKIDFNDAHRFSLPNRFFDYIKANIPVLSTYVPDIKAIIDQYNIGGFIEKPVPKIIADRILQAAANGPLYDKWKRNTIIAANDLCWENEEKLLLHFMKNLA